MLCPSCGKSVGDTLALCDDCRELKEQKLALSDSEIEVAERIKQEEIPAIPIGREQPCGSDLISHPLVICIVGLIIFLCLILTYILLG